ncbi:hypothetical protein [Marinovum algicola]|uniref:hypothetical protein n=1 Tax=Marinovum algicola TaxID=42444 RepID=UPI0024B9AA7E|nr:hypothetical protein [Marinovum algicola]
MTRDTDAQALDRLIEQEDVLQICYWYQGEGFGESFTPLAVLPFLKSGEGDVAEELAGFFLHQEEEPREKVSASWW